MNFIGLTKRKLACYLNADEKKNDNKNSVSLLQSFFRRHFVVAERQQPIMLILYLQTVSDPDVVENRPTKEG